MLILVDPSKTGDELRASAAQLGVESDFLETLVRDGYVAAVAGSDAPSAAPSSSLSPASPPVTTDELKRFRAAKAFINETIVDALGVRAFLFTLRLERCTTREELARLLPDYSKAIRKFRGESETQLIVERAKELLA